MKKLVKLWVFVFVIFSCVACGPKPPPKTHGLLYENAKQVKPFTLIDQFGKTITETALKGQWTLLFLGFTSCPDICPMTLAKLSQVHQRLGEKMPLDVWFVSVDPKRDTLEKRKLYIDYFNPSFSAVSAEHKYLFPFVRNLGLIYAIHDDGESLEYAVDHSASVTLVDPNGAVRAIFKPEFAKGQIPIVDTEKMVEDLTAIVTYYGH